MIIPIKIFKVLNLISHSAILVTRQIFLSCFVFLKESFFMIVYDPPQGAFSAFSIHLVSTTLEMTKRESLFIIIYDHLRAPSLLSIVISTER